MQNFDVVVVHTFECETSYAASKLCLTGFVVLLRLSSAEQKRRAEIMSAFSGFPQQLKPG